MALVLAACAWPTNADLVVDLVRLGYLKPEDRVLDPTWGRGKWWTKWEPAELTKHDKHTLDGSTSVISPRETARSTSSPEIRRTCAPAG